LGLETDIRLISKLQLRLSNKKEASAIFKLKRRNFLREFIYELELKKEKG